MTIHPKTRIIRSISFSFDELASTRLTMEYTSSRARPQSFTGLFSSIWHNGCSIHTGMINSNAGEAMKWLAIFNPRCGHHRPGELHQLSTEVRRRLGADIAWTRGRKDAARLVRHNRDYDGFIAVGGDGTISEIVNGFN